MSALAAIEALIERYFDFLHSGDLAEMDAIFLPQCDVIAATGGAGDSHTTFEAYRAAVAVRTAPKAAGYPRFGTITLIDQASPDLAIAKVESAVQPRYFRDYLTLVRVDGQWKIATKVYNLLRDEG